jgi:hypothetical protein
MRFLISPEAGKQILISSLKKILSSFLIKLKAGIFPHKNSFALKIGDSEIYFLFIQNCLLQENGNWIECNNGICCIHRLS